MKKIIGFWTNPRGFIKLDDGLFLISCGVVLTPVVVTIN